MLAVVISYDDRRAQSVKGMSRPSLSVTQPLPAPRSLTGELVARLTDDITSGKIPPGSQLPTEQELIAATGVSRTVVREAVAALRADGLVVTRQGVGAFVPENARRPLRIDVDPLSPLRAVLDVMELRTGIEIEAAGLAADRGSASQIRRIIECFDAVGAALKRGEDAVAQDFALHCSIADATGNPQFRRFLEQAVKLFEAAAEPGVAVGQRQPVLLASVHAQAGAGDVHRRQGPETFGELPSCQGQGKRRDLRTARIELEYRRSGGFLLIVRTGRIFTAHKLNPMKRLRQ